MIHTKKVIIAIITAILPFFIAINILRVNNPNNEGKFLGMAGALEILENADISFSKTYEKIAEAGEEWNSALNIKWWRPSGDFFEQVGQFFEYIGQCISALFKSIEIPIFLIVEIVTSIGKVIGLFLQYVGFIPGT